MKLEHIKKNIMQMGQNVEMALSEVIKALVQRRSESYAEVHRLEKITNDYHLQLDEECLTFLATHSPVAKDLRIIFSIIKINADLERMGDQTVNIAYTGKEYSEKTPLEWPIEIEEMGYIVQKMVRESLDSFLREDIELAQKVLALDNEVDQRKNSVFKKMMSVVHNHPESLEAAMDIILISRSLERLGDHTTNIAEDVIFVSTGQDIRHGNKTELK